MPLPLKDRKIGAIEYVIKRLKGSDSYDKMKDHNEHGYGQEKLMAREEPENDYKTGMKMAVNEMMTAMQSNDAEAFEKGLRGFVSMLIDANDDEKSMMEKED